MNNVEKAYIAGIIDGEGCFYVGFYIYKPRSEKTQFNHRLIVSNTDKRLIQWLVSTTGLGRVASRMQSKQPNRRLAYQWELYGNGIRNLIPQIMPYLVLKRRQAELMLESLEIRKSKGKGRGSPLSEEEREKRNELYSELRRLNARGLS